MCSAGHGFQHLPTILPFASGLSLTARPRMCGSPRRGACGVAWINHLNTTPRWRELGPGTLVVSAGTGAVTADVTLTLVQDGRIAGAFAADRPRPATPPTLPTPWPGRFADYRLHGGIWLPFAGEVAWEIEGKEVVYWQGQIKTWDAVSPCCLPQRVYDG